MSKLMWDETGQRFYETGVKRGALYIYDTSSPKNPYTGGVAWNGLTAVTESPSGAEASPLYADDIKYLNLYSEEEFGATIEAYTYPDEFAECDGSFALVPGLIAGQQARKMFGLCYRTALGNDVDGTDHGYKLHLIYGCKASPSDRSYATMNDSPEAITFSWELTTTKTDVLDNTGNQLEIDGTYIKPLSYMEIISTDFASGNKLKDFEAILYGAEAFSDTSTYAVGEYVTYAASESAAKTYRCKTAVDEAGAWDATDWDEVGVAGPALPLPGDVYTHFSAN